MNTASLGELALIVIAICLVILTIHWT